MPSYTHFIISSVQYYLLIMFSLNSWNSKGVFIKYWFLTQEHISHRQRERLRWREIFRTCKDGFPTRLSPLFQVQLLEDNPLSDSSFLCSKDSRWELCYVSNGKGRLTFSSYDIRPQTSSSTQRKLYLRKHANLIYTHGTISLFSVPST